MSSSKESNTTTQLSTSNQNVTKEVKEKDTKIDPKELIKIKESKFYELINLLQKWGYKVIDKSKENKIVGIEFQAEISPLVPYSNGLSIPIFLEFQNDLDDGFIIRTTFEIDKGIQSHLKGKAREIELTYIELEQLILPMKISILKSHPMLNLYKVIFYDDLKKQFFLDCINTLVNSMTLAIGKWNEKYHDINQENKPS